MDLAAHLAPCTHPVVQRLDGNQAARSELFVILTAHGVVDDTDVVTLARQVDRRRPAEVAVAAEDENTHDCLSGVSEWPLVRPQW